MKAIDILNTFEKSELIDIIVQYRESGYYPLELFTMVTDKHNYSLRELEETWEYLVDRANSFEDEGNPKAADILSDSANLIFHQVQRISNPEAKYFLNRMADDLISAAEEDGIGMDQDAEWVYLQIRDEILEYIG